jgi:hypothetical protein
MLDINEIPVHILKDISSAKEDCVEIDTISVKEAFNLYLVWNGFIGFTDQIIETLDALRAAEVK